MCPCALWGRISTTCVSRKDRKCKSIFMYPQNSSACEGLIDWLQYGHTYSLSSSASDLALARNYIHELIGRVSAYSWSVNAYSVFWRYPKKHKGNLFQEINLISYLSLLEDLVWNVGWCSDWDPMVAQNLLKMGEIGGSLSVKSNFYSDFLVIYIYHQYICIFVTPVKYELDWKDSRGTFAKKKKKNLHQRSQQTSL